MQSRCFIISVSCSPLFLSLCSGIFYKGAFCAVSTHDSVLLGHYIRPRRGGAMGKGGRGWKFSSMVMSRHVIASAYVNTLILPSSSAMGHSYTPSRCIVGIIFLSTAVSLHYTSLAKPDYHTKT